MMEKIIVVDAEKCLGCRSCELACAVAHSKSKDLFKAVREIPVSQSRVTVEGGKDFSIPLQCRHCENAPCVEICPIGAIERIDIESPVIINGNLCIGCKYCILVCPFGVIDIGHKGRVSIKCDMCIERLKEGKSPACVSACPTKALSFIPLKELTEERRKNTAKTVAVRQGNK